MPVNNIPTVFVVFGATGDLMAKKIAPALFHLYTKKKLPKMLRIFGSARRKLTDHEFRTEIKTLLIKHKIDKKNPLIEPFLKCFYYHQGRFENEKDYQSLAEILGRTDGEWKVCSNKLFYLAVPPKYTKTILNNLATSGLTIPCSNEEGWTRVIVEKPFGRDLKTAQELDLLLGKLFREEQIYRIDHYLAKEMLQNILSFRFSNNLFEESWNNKFIEKIEIRAHENIGVEGRGEFYDGVGALRDYGQNHLLQMLALITIKQPYDYRAETVRTRRLKLLSELKIYNASEIAENTIRGQYIGYRAVKGVRPNSQTETFFRIRAQLENPRWRGIPIILESGKRLRRSLKEIVVTFKHHSPCLCPTGAKRHFQNKITFSLEPKEVIRIQLLAKAPGLAMTVEEQKFNFSYRHRSKDSQYAEEYEKLLLDCIEGNQLLFLSTEEVQATWRFIDPIINAWEKNQVPLIHYEPDKNIILKEKIKEERKLRKEIGIIGLGKMGGNLAKQLLDAGWKVVGYNRSLDKATRLGSRGLIAARSVSELVKKLRRPRVVYLLLPAGQPTDNTIDELLNHLEQEDIIIESGNSYYKDTIARAKRVSRHKISFVDVGISGGPKGARYGACLMVGGDKKIYNYLLPLFTEVSVAGGTEHFDGIGAGHFVKMVHNGIEYGMMQAIAEGFAILKNSAYRLDLIRVAEIYNHGSVVESQLVSWLRDGLELYGQGLSNVSSSVARGGESNRGEADWTLEVAEELKLKAKVIEEAVKFREQSFRNPEYTGKLINTMRHMFGGHSISKSEFRIKNSKAPTK